MAATRKHESDAYMHATATARRMREVVGEALGAMVGESDAAGGRDELAKRLQEMLQIEQRMNEAQGRYLQATEMGLPLRPSQLAWQEQKILLRAAVMNIGATCGRWVATMDYEIARERDPKLNGLGATAIRRTTEEG